MSIKYVILAQRGHRRGQEAALPKLSFDSQIAAQDHLDTKLPSWQRPRCRVAAREVSDKVEQRMTCQCCGRAILAETGTIALHGYQRPGYGWQTQSCMGAKHLPFEVDRARLAQLISALTGYRNGMVGDRASVAGETMPVPCRWRTRSASVRGGWDNHSFDFTRANFDSEEAKPARNHVNYGVRFFDDLLARDLARRDHEIEMITRDIRDHQARYDGWKQTHLRQDGVWKKCGPKLLAELLPRVG